METHPGHPIADSNRSKHSSKRLGGRFTSSLAASTGIHDSEERIVPGVMKISVEDPPVKSSNSGYQPYKKSCNYNSQNSHAGRSGAYKPKDTTAPRTTNMQMNQNDWKGNRNADNRYARQPNTYRKIFEEYVTEEEARKGIEDGTMFKGTLRINPRNYQECFIDHPKGSAYSDVFVLGPDRNRAMHNDIVVVRIKPRTTWVVNDEEYKKWKSKSVDIIENERKANTASEEQKDTLDVLLNRIDLTKDAPKFQNNNSQQKLTLKDIMERDKIEEIPDSCLHMMAAVVLISDKRHSRIAAGKLQRMPNNMEHVLFVATDSRVPRIMIPNEDVDEEFFRRPSDFEKFLYMARIVDWRAESIYADGRLEKLLGESGCIETETQRILCENDVDQREFSEEALDCLPISSAEEWSIPESEFKYRRDFRDQCVFTIDPKTARDLDDALSISRIDDCDGKGTPGWEIGVHIADVTFFIEDECVLDNWAERRGNSTYLAQMVIPMLPRILSEQLCSLNPAVDRLCFSTVFKMDDQAMLKDVWFGRTIIRSRVKLAYEHAQDFIEHPEKDFDESELPPISDGSTVYEIKEKVLQLHRVAQLLRKDREANGALRIEQPKLKFSLDPETKQPQGVTIYQIRDSNKLVEEFMLLANMEVAKRIERAFPSSAMLRRHPPPKEKMIREVAEQCAKMGFPLDGVSSKCLSTSLRRYGTNSQLHICIRQVVSSLTIKPMQMALYFCVSEVSGPSEYRHYALNVDHYTHFTSPIRRYPDMVVHRQLAAALGYCRPIERSGQQIHKIAMHCNDKKLASKTCSDASEELYFGVFVHATGVLCSRAVVMQVLDKAFNVQSVQYGVNKRVYLDQIGANVVRYDLKNETLVLRWPEDKTAEEGNRDSFEQSIRMCTVLDVEFYPLRDVDVGARVLRPTLAQRKTGEKTLSCMFRDVDNSLEIE